MLYSIALIALFLSKSYCLVNSFPLKHQLKMSNLVPYSSREYAQRALIKSLTTVIPLTVAVKNSLAKSNNDMDTNINMPFGENGYSQIGNIRMTKILNGMWQVSGAHGFQPNRDLVVAEMARCADQGFTTFDLADIYGPAEDLVGDFCKGTRASSLAKECQFFTKWVPRPEEITKKMADEAIHRSLFRMKTDSLDLLQFHWWDYQNKYYYDAMDHLIDFQETGLIKNIGLTNFDTTHMSDLISEGAPIVSNQVSFSIVDTRPLQMMIPYNKANNVQLLCYGTLLGGFISQYWLNKPEPEYSSLTNVSLRKYLPWISYWGGWSLFQELLRTLDIIAIKHSVSLSTVALRWVVDQPTVAGAIVGVRFGLKEHYKDNLSVFRFKLDDSDLVAISDIQKKSKDLLKVFGDCGGEYRRRA